MTNSALKQYQRHIRHTFRFRFVNRIPNFTFAQARVGEYLLLVKNVFLNSVASVYTALTSAFKGWFTISPFTGTSFQLKTTILSFQIMSVTSDTVQQKTSM